MGIEIELEAPNFLSVQLRGLRVWFSYKTPVAFCVNGGRRVVRQNDWGPTTGKHLNALDGGSKEARAERLDSAAFKVALDAACEKKGF